MITIMTPTYNRAKLLCRLYESLKKQKNHDFEWLIVDDGSEDSTKSVVEGFISENKVNIRYIYQENSGKARAFNNGVINARGDLFFCVDSDDYLVENAVEMISSCVSAIENGDVAGIIALKEDVSGKRLGNDFPAGMKYESTFKLSEFYKCRGEWSLIYKTAVLKNHLFPEIPNEKFITECVVYDKIAQNYQMYLLNEVVTICEYQDDGLSNNIVLNMIKNPIGYKIFYSQRIDMEYRLKKKLGYIIRYNAFRCLSNDSFYNYHGDNILLVKILSFTGFFGKVYYTVISKSRDK